MSDEYQLAVRNEQRRLRIAAGWAQVNLSESAKQFARGRADRVAGKLCASANGSYLDGWYFGGGVRNAQDLHVSK